MSSEHVIAVGIDGSVAAWAAFDWAAEHAELTGRSLWVVHAGDTTDAPDGVTQRAFGRDLLDEAIVTLADARPHVAATTRLVEGGPTTVLTEVSATADLLVLGRGERSAADVLLGSVVGDVLRHAHCPTVVVPGAARTAANVIVAGASHTDSGQSALRFAFEEAARRSADLVVVRSTSTRHRDSVQLDDAVRRLSAAFPVQAARTVITGEPAEIALERAAHDAALLVLGHRRSGTAAMQRLGPVASWAIRHFDCPVAVVGHAVLEPADEYVALPTQALAPEFEMNEMSRRTR